MKKVLVAAAIVCAIAFTVNAAEGKKQHQLTDEQKALQKEMLEKYDANKDGKLDKDEKAKMSQEDKQKWKATFGQAKKDAHKDAAK